MTVRIGPSPAPFALKRFCGIAWRFVAAFDLLCFGLKRSSLNPVLIHVAVASNTLDSVKNMVTVNSDIGIIIVEIKCVHEQRCSESGKHLHAAAVKTEKIMVDCWMRVETAHCSNNELWSHLVAGPFCFPWEVEVQRGVSVERHQWSVVGVQVHN